MDCDKILDMQFKMTDAGRIDRVRDLYTTFNPDVDLEAMKKSGYVDALYAMMEPVLMSFDDYDPRVLAYWAKRGMVKESHGADKPMSWSEYESKTGYHWEDPNRQGLQNLAKRWNAFVPVSAFREENKGRRYPVVVALHGGFNPISIIDGWGFVQEAARREWIVIVPTIELDDVLDEILADVKKLYPVDESRIYAMGFSYGGFMSNLLGCKRPDVYAAVAPCGAPISDGYTEKAQGPEPQKPFDGKSRAKAMGVYMPIINVNGNLDGNRFPLYDFVVPSDMPPSMRSITAQTLLDGINWWADVNGAQQIKMEDVMKLKETAPTEAEKYLRIPLAPGCGQRTDTDGLTCYAGDMPSADGVSRLRIVVEMNTPHWPTPELSCQVFSFFSHFSRDPVTHESIYHP